MTDTLLARARSLPANVSWAFHGAVGYSEIKRHYETQQVDLFLSLSETEGIPVSMMEAISYGVPILACRTGGIPELVNEATGILAGVETPLSQIAAMMRDALRDYSFDSSAIRAFFRKHYSASVNFGSFARRLSEIVQA